jgi:hypothetical protein
MPAFSWSSRFREGQWRSLRKFALEERRDASARYQVIEAERQRIGSIFILWEKDEQGTPTERRRGFSLDEGTSLAKLVQVYVALGGNPFDISMFIGPETSSLSGDIVTRNVPYGGVLTMQEMKYAYDQGSVDRDGNFLKFRYSRYGGPIQGRNEAQVADLIERLKKPFLKEIHYKRTRIEEQIIKLCDLREQLDQEVEDLVWSTYGDLSADISWQDERYSRGSTAASIVYTLDSIFRVPDPADPGRVPLDPAAEAGQPGSFNTRELGEFPTLMLDLPEEEDSSL